MRKHATCKTTTLAKIPLPFQPALSGQQWREIDASADAYGIDRRLALLVLTKTSEELLASFRKDVREHELGSFQVAGESIEAYIRHLQGMLEIAECAQARLVLVAGIIAREHGIKAA